MLRKAIAFLRRHRIDLQSAHRRDAYDWSIVLRRLMAGRDPRVVFDIGAHWGEMCREHHRLFPGAKVHAFEPTPHTFRRLRENLGGQPWVELVNAAAGESDGEVSFFMKEEYSSTTNSVLPFAEGDFQEVKVQSVRLDTYCRERSIGRIDCLKIDVEGFELSVLEGARGLLEAGAIDVIFAEARGEPMRPGAATIGSLSQFLGGMGYTLFGFYSIQWYPNLLINWFDAIWISDGVFRRYVGREPRHQPATSAPPSPAG